MSPTMTRRIAATVACSLLASSVDAFVPSAMTSSTSTTSSATSTRTTELNTMSFNEDVLASSNLPGNFGFDPLHCAQTQELLVTYRKAEMKHARLAILAVMAIMWSDLHVADNLGATPLLEGRAFPEFLGACVGLPAALELYGERVEQDHADDAAYFPGQLDLDPFHLYPASTVGQQRVQFAEIMTGRACMLAAAGRLTKNALVGLGVLGEEESLLSLVAPLQSTAESVEEVIA